MLKCCSKASSCNAPRKIASQTGMTLIEVLIAMAIFLIVSAGVAGTMTIGLRATVHSRQATSGKAAAQEQFEEMKGLTFYVPYSTDHSVGSTAVVDLLDRYYPNLSTSKTVDSQGWTGWYTQSGGDAYYTRTSPADNQGIIRTVVTRFVDNQGNIIVPTTSYNSRMAGTDVPPSQLVRVSISTSSTLFTGSNYTLDSLISATSGASCANSSNSHVDVFGGVLKVTTGDPDPTLTSLVDGSFGEAHATTGFGCTPSPQASATGGKTSVFGGNTATGATVAVSGPPDSQQTAGPIDVTSLDWPTPGFYGSSASASQTSGGSHQVSAKGNTTVNTQTMRLQQVDGTSDDGVSGYQRWDFVNPTVTITGARQPGGDDECEDDDDDDGGEGCAQMVFANLTQNNGTTSANAHAAYQQVNILPLQAISSDTPSALQGLVFVRTFTADANSSANGTPGGIQNSLTYSISMVGVFNPNSDPGCTGDSCYDKYYSIGPGKTYATIQDAVNLAQSKYGLQQSLFTEWSSFSSSDIASAKAASADGTTSSVNADALVKLSARFGTEVRMSQSDGSVVLVNPQGLQQVWLGSMDISILQNV